MSLVQTTPILTSVVATLPSLIWGAPRHTTTRMPPYQLVCFLTIFQCGTVKAMFDRQYYYKNITFLDLLGGGGCPKSIDDLIRSDQVAENQIMRILAKQITIEEFTV